MPRTGDGEGASTGSSGRWPVKADHRSLAALGRGAPAGSVTDHDRARSPPSREELGNGDGAEERPDEAVGLGFVAAQPLEQLLHVARRRLKGRELAVQLVEIDRRRVAGPLVSGERFLESRSPPEAFVDRRGEPAARAEG